MVVPKELRDKRNFQHQDHGRSQANVREWLEKSDCNLPSESLQFLVEACATRHDVKGFHYNQVYGPQGCFFPLKIKTLYRNTYM